MIREFIRRLSALRRGTQLGCELDAELRFHLEQQDCIFLMGPILQEILDGVRSEGQCDKLLRYFSVFPLVDLGREDYAAASQLRNVCRSKGIQAGAVDFLIAAACRARNYPLLTGDRDFKLIAGHAGLILL